MTAEPHTPPPNGPRRRALRLPRKEWRPEDYGPERILWAVALVTGISAESLRGTRRKFARERQLCAYLIFEKCQSLNLIKIGRFLDRDRTTVVHSQHVTEQRLARDPELRAVCDRVLAVLDGGTG